MKFWINLVGYQLVWFCTVIGAGHGLAWPALLAVALFAAMQLTISDNRRVDLQLVGVAVLIGIVLEGTLAYSGLVHYTAHVPALPPGGAPLWILALWAAFALTLRQSLRYLQAHPRIAALLGAIGAPLAYASASRGWSAVTFAAPAWHALVVIGMGWAIGMPLLATLARRWSQTAVQSTAPQEQAS